MQETTNDIEQLLNYYNSLVLTIEEHRIEFIELLEEKKRIEFILSKTNTNELHRAN